MAARTKTIATDTTGRVKSQLAVASFSNDQVLKIVHKDTRYMAFAKFLSRGEEPEEAFKKAQFEGSISDAHKLAKIRVIKGLVLAYREGITAVVQAATPLALMRNLELMAGEHGASAAVQQRAADSILDRGGVPKVSKAIIDKKVEVTDALGSLLGGADEVAILVRRGAERAKKKLKA